MFDLFWWHWVILGFGLIVAELFVPGFVIIWFGLGGFLVALALGLVPDLSITTQMVLWTLSSIAMTAVWFRVFRPARRASLIGRASAQVMGEVGLLVADSAPFQQGRVRFQKPILGSDVWDCRSEEEIKSGARVRLTAIEGNVVVVEKV